MKTRRIPRSPKPTDLPEPTRTDRPSHDDPTATQLPPTATDVPPVDTPTATEQIVQQEEPTLTPTIAPTIENSPTPTESNNNQQGLQLNLSHIVCLNNGMVEIHFVLLNVPDGVTPGTLTYTYGSIAPGAHTGNVWHYTDNKPSGYYNITSASVVVNGTTVYLHNPGAYAGTYSCGATPTLTTNLTPTFTPTPTNTPTELPTNTPTNTPTENSDQHAHQYSNRDSDKYAHSHAH